MYLSVGRRSNLPATNAILQNLYKLQTIDIAGLTRSDPHAAGLRGTIPPGILANYDRARARGEKGIALVRNHVCTNCRIQVPVAVTVSLAAGMIQACGNCALSVPSGAGPGTSLASRRSLRTTPQEQAQEPYCQNKWGNIKLNRQACPRRNVTVPDRANHGDSQQERRCRIAMPSSYSWLNALVSKAASA
jgi:hypothetical protein